MKITKLKLGEMLKEAGLVTSEQVEKALREQKIKKKHIGDILVELGYVTEKDIAEVLAAQLEIPFVSGEKDMLRPKVGQRLDVLISPEVARRYSIIPLSFENNILSLAMADPSDVMILDNVKKIANCEINPVIAVKSDIKKAQDEFYGEQNLFKEAVEQSYRLEGVQDLAAAAKENAPLDEAAVMAESAPVVKLVDLLLIEAIKARASDIHIEPFERKLNIRYRIDGKLYEITPPSEYLIAPLLSRIKIMSKMDIAEKRLPQDGAFSLKTGDKVVDFRVSTMPTIFGEKIVIRLLDKTSIILRLEDMGLSGEMLANYKETITKPYGLIFITGPTGSGKSTTLYATLRVIATPEKNVITIEDPVEYQFDGINQVQVKPNIGLTFASGVRTSLRQDPDIILVGEVRDFETAQNCVRAALTGHLVLSTLHTNDAPSAVVRLKDLGIEPFLIGSSLLLVEAQRLVRRLCPKCKEPYKPYSEEIEKFKLAPTIYRARGCDECRRSGYRGRIGIYEVMMVTEPIRELIYKSANTTDLRKLALAEGMTPLLLDGITKVNAGVTSLEEVLAATYGEA